MRGGPPVTRRNEESAEPQHERRDLPWEALARLWSDAATTPVHTAEIAIVHAMVAIRDLIESRYAVFMFGMREPEQRMRDSFESIQGWRPCGLIRDPEEPPERIAIRQQWTAERTYVNERSTYALMDSAGVARAATHRELAPPGTWESSPARDLLQRLGASSRLIAAIPLGPDLEAYMAFDREPPMPEFDERTKQTALAALEGLAPVLLRLARLYGFERGAPLTPRERSLLRALLTGASEKEIAARVDMTWRSAHRRIADIYRKIGVTTRAELMAYFLEGSTTETRPRVPPARSQVRRAVKRNPNSAK